MQFLVQIEVCERVGQVVEAVYSFSGIRLVMAWKSDLCMVV